VATRTELPPHLRARYGLDRRRGFGGIVAGLLIAVFAAVVVGVGFAGNRQQIEATMLAYHQVSADHVDVTFEVRKGSEQIVHCVVRAQDRKRADVGYALTVVPAGSTYQQVTYPLRTLAPAFYVELLGCGDGAPPERVPAPQFPWGVVAPPQPWTP
jgi:hypothetical protein